MGDAPKTPPTLLLRLRDAQDHEAWALFVRVYGPLIYGFVRKQGLQDADAADVMQDAFRFVAGAIRQLDYYPQRGSFRAWLFTVVRNQLLRFRSRQDRAGRGTGDSSAHRRLDEEEELEEWGLEYERSRFGEKRPLPPYLQPADTIVVEKDGLRDKDRYYIRTKTADYLTKDFRLELIFSTKATGNGMVYIGIGEADRRGRFFEPASSVYLRIHPPDLSNGDVGLSKEPFKGGIVIGRLPAGTHRAIIEKKGKAVLFAVDVNHDGPTKNDLAYTVLDINRFGPFLNAKNTHLFFGGGGLYEEIALSDKTGSALFKPRPVVKIVPPPVVKSEKVEIKLPGGFEQVRTGGAGRYLIFHVKAKKKRIVFDAVKAKLTHEIEAPDDVAYAAGLEKLLVALPGSRLLQRWDLTTGEREKTVPIPGAGAVQTVLMGSAGRGPFLLFTGKQFVPWDVERMSASGKEVMHAFDLTVDAPASRR